MKEMTVTSAGIMGGMIALRYGKHGSQKGKNGTPTLSPPLTVENAPDGTVCFAVSMWDPDSRPVCGFEWQHWLAANFKSATLPENASIDNAKSMVQGRTDDGTNAYSGPRPPDRPHEYFLKVYALDQLLELRAGFSAADLERAAEGHVLASATISGVYPDRI